MAILTEGATEYRYEGNGVTDTFSFPSKAFSSSFLVVQILDRATDTVEETLTITTDYTVTILASGFATIQVTNATKIPYVDEDILIYLDLPYTQTLELPSGNALPTQSIETALDKLTVLIQQQNGDLGRSIVAPRTEISGTANLELPAISVRANTYLAFDSSGNVIVSAGTTSSPISTAMEPVVSSSTLALGRTAFGVPALSGSQTFIGAQKGSVVSLTSSGGHIAIDLNTGNNFTHTLTEDTVLDNPSNMVAGQSGQITLNQHASSAKTLGWGSYWKSIDGTTQTISTTTSAQNLISWYASDATHIWFSLSKGGVS